MGCSEPRRGWGRSTPSVSSSTFWANKLIYFLTGRRRLRRQRGTSMASLHVLGSPSVAAVRRFLGRQGTANRWRGLLWKLFQLDSACGRDGHTTAQSLRPPTDQHQGCSAKHRPNTLNILYCAAALHRHQHLQFVLSVVRLTFF